MYSLNTSCLWGIARTLVFHLFGCCLGTPSEARLIRREGRWLGQDSLSLIVQHLLHRPPFSETPQFTTLSPNPHILVSAASLHTARATPYLLSVCRAISRKGKRSLPFSFPRFPLPSRFIPCPPLAQPSQNKSVWQGWKVPHARLGSTRVLVALVRFQAASLPSRIPILGSLPLAFCV